MTLEERVEFLHQSIESHDRQLGELAERMETTEQMVRNLAETTRLSFERADARMARTEESVNLLVTAMRGLTEHVSEHHQRIQRLEG